jgi:hypothetical protein
MTFTGKETSTANTASATASSLGSIPRPRTDHPQPPTRKVILSGTLPPGGQPSHYIQKRRQDETTGRQIPSAFIEQGIARIRYGWESQAGADDYQRHYESGSAGTCGPSADSQAGSARWPQTLLVVWPAHRTMRRSQTKSQCMACRRLIRHQCLLLQRPDGYAEPITSQGLADIDLI